MDIVYSALVFLHLLGMAGIIAGWLLQLIAKHSAAPKAILHSSLLQLATGLLLVGVAEMGDGDLNHVKIGVKVVVAFAVAVVGLLNLRKPDLKLANAAGALTVLNVGIAVFW
ncbi:hypothetical protein [Marinitenerispora sediminis]|uniref:Integral membrane protein n=1 Tax=Marinitenerispora sediminis TaxID=1931232 RepID=A0A368T954_9ACTN|nr:hypothetical protein [Marinitenerispora sediminis]RCV47737.1 hypothetical protein DEF28_25435 [Marinitenerispora sediminis]RCV48256.1 hypothetical protein DEF23_25285 [Marinitenerispora sediminis]RCV60955.1 hypothetical protein DEF24_05395 [Marinitenerispora sediminis]